MDRSASMRRSFRRISFSRSRRMSSASLALEMLNCLAGSEVAAALFSGRIGGGREYTFKKKDLFSRANRLKSQLKEGRSSGLVLQHRFTISSKDNVRACSSGL